MGCLVSTPQDSGSARRTPANIGEVSVYVPGLRIPKPVDCSQQLGNHLSRNLVERLSALRTRIVIMAGQEAPTITRTKRKSATQHGGSTLADLQQALDDYLPMLLGLVKEGTQLQQKVSFVWINQEDEAEETTMSCARYEVLSVLHLMAMLSLSQANLLLLPRTSSDGYQAKLSEESRRASIDVFLKAAGYLDCAIHHVLPEFPAEVRSQLPVDLAEGVLQALCLQSLGLAADVQLGLAIDSTKATLAVKRRLACEMVKYWQQYYVARSINPSMNAAPWLNLVELYQSSEIVHRCAPKVKAQTFKSNYQNKVTPAKETPDEMHTHNEHDQTDPVKSLWPNQTQTLDQMAHGNLLNLPLTNGWAEKHRLYVKWKYAEAKAAAYYYHGMILDEGNTEKSHGIAVAALQAADEYLKESKSLSEAFNATPPLSRNPPLWGTAKFLSEKVPKDTSSKVRINRDLYTEEKLMETTPPLPDFALALKPDEYQLPEIDKCWNDTDVNGGELVSGQHKNDRR